MDRRTFLKALPLGLTATGGFCLGTYLRRLDLEPWPTRRPDYDPLAPSVPFPPAPVSEAIEKDPARDEGSHLTSGRERSIEKSRDFDRHYEDDRWIELDRLPMLRLVNQHLERAQRIIGHGHFNLISFDQLLRYGGRYAEIGSFTRVEVSFIELLFGTDAAEYGFFGKKVLRELTATIPGREVAKIPRSGHYLLRGDPLEKYQRVRRDLGSSIVLTSGVRGIVKQLHLFLDKAVRSEGNLSMAARSLAPPGYSYHAIGDFDLGKVGLGERNFTDSFAMTEEYRKLIDLGYVEIRYDSSNPFGVRHEPWHIKIGHRG